MKDNALVIETDGSVRPIALPLEADGRRAAIRELVGGAFDIGRYHRGVHLHVNGSGVLGSNLVAWAVASAWRGFDLGYDLHGPVVVTSSTDGEALPDDLADQVRAAAEAVAEIAAEWRDRPPVSEQAAFAELLAAVQFRVPAGI